MPDPSPDLLVGHSDSREEREWEVEVTLHHEGTAFVMATTREDAERLARDGGHHFFADDSVHRIGLRSHAKLVRP